MSTDDFSRRLRISRWGVLLALLTIFFGFGIGGAFGAFEEPMKKGLADRAAAVLDTVYKGDAAKAKSVVDKSWVYYKRAHLHGGAVGAVALGGILLLAALRRPNDHVRRGVSVARPTSHRYPRAQGDAGTRERQDARRAPCREPGIQLGDARHRTR